MKTLKRTGSVAEMGQPNLSLVSALASIAPHLEMVESELLLISESTAPASVGDLVRHGCVSGGKRLRPALVFMCASALEDIRPSHLTLAVALEMIHAASLVHDDVMDEATVRRGQPTPNSIWGNRIAIKLGDLLLAKALRLVSGLGSRKVAELVTTSASDVCRGEILQSRNTNNPRLTADQYYEIVSLKTGSLFSAASAGAALIAEVNSDVVSSLSEFGRLLGLSYQIYDDCADLTGSSVSLGKTLGTDLESGKMTLPIIMFLEKHPQSDSPQVLELLWGKHGRRFEDARLAILESGVIASSVEAGLGMLERADFHLECLPQNARSKALGKVVDHIRCLFRAVTTTP